MLEKDCRWVNICQDEVLKEGYERPPPLSEYNPSVTVVTRETENMAGRIHRRLDCLNFLHQLFVLSRTLQPSIKEEFYSTTLQFPPPKNENFGGVSLFSVLSMVLNKSTADENSGTLPSSPGERHRLKGSSLKKNPKLPTLLASDPPTARLRVLLSRILNRTVWVRVD